MNDWLHTLANWLEAGQPARPARVLAQREA